MRVITLLQPWATFVVLRLKKIETRSFNTLHRGKFLVHSSNSKPTKEMLQQHEEWVKEFGVPEYSVENYPIGCILGSAELIGTAPTGKIKTNDPNTFPDNFLQFDRQEEAFGNYDLGRYGWLLKDAVQFKTPIPALGDLSWWQTCNKKAFKVVEMPVLEVQPMKYELQYYGQSHSIYQNRESANAVYEAFVNKKLTDHDIFFDTINTIEKNIFQ